MKSRKFLIFLFFDLSTNSRSRSPLPPLVRLSMTGMTSTRNLEGKMVLSHWKQSSKESPQKGPDRSVGRSTPGLRDRRTTRWRLPTAASSSAAVAVSTRRKKSKAATEIMLALLMLLRFALIQCSAVRNGSTGCAGRVSLAKLHCAFRRFGQIV